MAVWKQTIGPGGGERDLCICSPTGSGKTLAYSLPVVQMLSSRVVRRLRALIVLPTRDLAIQVYISTTYKTNRIAFDHFYGVVGLILFSISVKL